MTKLRVHCFTVSLDGYGAGPSQGLDNPLGVGGLELHAWLVGARTFHELLGTDGGYECGEHVTTPSATHGGYECSEHVMTPSATHFVLTNRAERSGASP